MNIVIGIAGSPRKNGNSTTLMRAALRGARRAGAETKEVYLNGLDFKGCQNCPKCSPHGKCVLNDPLAEVIDELHRAAGWILASPIYFDSVSGQMKTFLDRCYCLTMDPSTQKHRPQLSGKRKGLIIVTYEDDPREDYRREAEKIAYYLKWMGDFERVEIVSEGGLGPANAAADKPELVARTEQYGAEVFGIAKQA